ncbi:MAG: hypothetical protein E3J96_00310 [Sulfurovum sp.]|nr:MAG: hypothetical protein E3J96_00310 [Sulfurovum sp.]
MVPIEIVITEVVYETVVVPNKVHGEKTATNTAITTTIEVDGMRDITVVEEIAIVTLTTIVDKVIGMVANLHTENGKKTVENTVTALATEEDGMRDITVVEDIDKSPAYIGVTPIYALIYA